VDLFKRSLLVVRTQIDNGGAIIAANDSDIMQFRATPIPNSGRAMGRWSPTRWTWRAFRISRACSIRLQDVITETAIFITNIIPHGSPASSWHPWVLKGPAGDADSGVLKRRGDLEPLATLLRYRDIEFVRPSGSISCKRPRISW